MQLPSIQHEKWWKIVRGEVRYDLKFLPVKLLLGNFVPFVGGLRSEADIDIAVARLYSIFANNLNVSTVQYDLETIFGEEAMNNKLLPLSTVSQMITSGKTLILAGDEDALARLPKGNWIAGTTSYFMTKEFGGAEDNDMVFVTDISCMASSFTIRKYKQNDLCHVYEASPKPGFTFLIIPMFSDAHLSFSVNAPNYNNFASHPLVGWISGTNVKDIGRKKPKVFDGTTLESFENDAIAFHVMLDAGKIAQINIINLFEPGEGDAVMFDSDGVAPENIVVDGEMRNFYDYVIDHGIDTKLPLVADYYGAKINVSFNGIDKDKRKITFGTPVLCGIRYKHAKFVADYIKEFQKILSLDASASYNNIAFSCNCFLNYMYSRLEGKKTDPFYGPITFGEIAYQLLNQTLVYLELLDVQPTVRTINVPR